MKGFERQIAVIASRQELHKRIDALPDNAEILIISAVKEQSEDGRFSDAASLDVVGIHPFGINERVAWHLQSALSYLFSGVHHRG